ncbi:unnamed protein product [Rotaria sordida]|uniref:C2 domain-containing protein n=1 Tax=Rotaria sordida TaxID=392033 RepID=A0A814PI24_9BILA|nr:unnamed protein product [Rotaria sordida]
MPTGTLEVIVVEGRHLKDRDLVGENDTYVEIYLDKKYKQRITTISNSNNTVWNQCFTFNLQKGDDTIHFDIYDADVIGRDSIGNCKAESSQQEESKPTQGAQRIEFVRPELTSTKNNNTNENDEPKSDQSDDSDDEASISSDIRKQIPILNDSQIKVQMATARIRKTKQLVEGSQPLARSKQIPREEKNPVPQAVATSENSIFITGLPKTMSEDLLFRTLRDAFSTVGKIEIDKTTKNPSIYLFKEKDKPSELSGRGKITFQKEESAKKAIEIYNGKRIKSLNNSQIYVKNFQAKTPKVLPPTPEPKPPISLMQIPQASDILTSIDNSSSQSHVILFEP